MRKKEGRERDGERKGGSIKLGEANLAFLQIFCMLVAKRRKCHSHQQHWKSICLLRLKCLARNPYNSYFFSREKMRGFKGRLAHPEEIASLVKCFATQV